MAMIMMMDLWLFLRCCRLCRCCCCRCRPAGVADAVVPVVVHVVAMGTHAAVVHHCCCFYRCGSFHSVVVNANLPARQTVGKKVASVTSSWAFNSDLNTHVKLKGFAGATSFCYEPFVNHLLL